MPRWSASRTSTTTCARRAPTAPSTRCAPSGSRAASSARGEPRSQGGPRPDAARATTPPSSGRRARRPRGLVRPRPQRRAHSRFRRSSRWPRCAAPARPGSPLARASPRVAVTGLRHGFTAVALAHRELCDALVGDPRTEDRLRVDVDPQQWVHRPILGAWARSQIRTYGDPVLRDAIRDVEEIDGRVASLADMMIETMYAAPGVGLAATRWASPSASSSTTPATGP